MKMKRQIGRHVVCASVCASTAFALFIDDPIKNECEFTNKLHIALIN